MKNLYSLLITIFSVGIFSAQLVITEVSPGVIKLTYGASGDYSLYDPGYQMPIYVHSWININDNTASTLFDDVWANSNITMNYDAAVGAYVATIDLNTKTFTNSNNTVPASTTINNVGFVFKDQQNGATRQSANLIATNYGFTGTTTATVLAISDVVKFTKKSIVVSGNLYTAQTGNLNIQIYDLSGKLLKTMNVKSTNEPIQISLAQKGLYILKVSNGQNVETLKFAY